MIAENNNKTKTTEKNFNRPYLMYAQKLTEFLNKGKYDKEICIMLGVIAIRSIQKHTKFHDEIRTAIGALYLEDLYGVTLIGACKAQVENSINFNY